MKSTRPLLMIAHVLAIIFLFSGCNNPNNPDEISIIKVTEEGSAKLSDMAIVNLLKAEADLNVDIQYDLSEDVALEMLRKGEVELAIIPNNTMVSGTELAVRAIMPLLPRIVMVIKHEDAKGETLKELFEGNLVVFEALSRMDSFLIEKLAVTFGIDLKKVNAQPIKTYMSQTNLDKPAVYVGLTHLHNPIVKKLLKNNWSLSSLDDVGNLNQGSSVEGFIFNFPSAYPFILPRSYYEGKPTEPILTLAIVDVLVARSDLDTHLVYNITKTLIENQSQLIQMDEVYSILDTDLEASNLSFPLHSGAMNYMMRNKPSIWIQYSQRIWPFVSMLAILGGMFASFRTRLKRNQKDKINSYYKELLEIRKMALSGDTNELILMNKMRKLRADAFMELSDNELQANESFEIFLSLYSEIKDEIAE